MDWNEYQEWTRTTAVYDKRDEFPYLLTGLSGEVGELLSIYAKMYRGDPNPATLGDAVEKELGDILWFVARLADARGTDLQSIVDKNVAKLEDRKARNKIQGSGDDR